jgi:hypothetical protein
VGFWKNRQIAQDEMGFAAPPGCYVCDRHVDDYALEALIDEKASESECSFCDRRADEAIAADTDLVLEHIARSLEHEWTDPVNVLFYDSEDDQWAGAVFDFEEVLGEEGEWPFSGDSFETFVLDAFRDSTWTGRDPAALGENEALQFSWRGFKDTVKHEARFLFVLLDEHDDENASEPGWPLRLGGAMLRELGDLINRYGLVADIPEGTQLHRIRVHGVDEHPTTAKALGTPPSQFARQSRMSPAGIPMFYGATDIETASAETMTADVKAATKATFSTTRVARIVDLDRLPAVPSFFDLSEGAIQNRPSLGFLDGFRHDVSAQIERDDRIHIEYVPTQVVCEYLRHLFRDQDGHPVDGLAWESAQYKGGRNLVLFARNEQCLEPDEPPPAGLDEGRLALRLTNSSPLAGAPPGAGRDESGT